MPPPCASNRIAKRANFPASAQCPGLGRIGVIHLTDREGGGAGDCRSSFSHVQLFLCIIKCSYSKERETARDETEKISREGKLVRGKQEFHPTFRSKSSPFSENRTWNYPTVSPILASTEQPTLFFLSKLTWASIINQSLESGNDIESLFRGDAIRGRVSLATTSE